MPAVTCRVVSACVATTAKPVSMDHTADVITYELTKGAETARVTIVVACGRFDAPTAKVVGYHHAVAEQYGASLIVCTEAEEAQVEAHELVCEGKGWQVAKIPGAAGSPVGEYMWAWDALVFRPAARGQRRTRMTKVPGLVDWRNLFVGTQWLRFIPLNIATEVMIGHTPAGVQDGKEYSAAHPLRVRAHRNGCKAWGRYSHKARGVVWRLFTGDWNLDLHADNPFMAELETALNATCAWRDHEPAGGDHAGGRLIGGAFHRIDC